MSTADAPNAPFDVHALARMKGGAGYVPVHNSADTGWKSVLLQVGRRDDLSGSAELGPVDHPRFLLATRGSQKVRRRDVAVRSAVQFGSGRTWLVPPGTSYAVDWRLDVPARREMALLTIPHDTFAATARSLSEQARRPVDWRRISLVDDRIIASVMRGVLETLVDGRDDLYAESASAFLSHHVLTSYGEGPSRPLRVGHEDGRVRAAIEYMHDGLEEPLTLADIADHVGLSTYHLIRVFRATTGEPPRRYLSRLRIEASARRLADPEMSIAAVAAQYGFSDASHFATAFRRETGLSPREYRARLRLP